jgi:type I restriction enzyme S subunit
MSEWARAPFGDLYAEGSRNGISIPKATRGEGVPMVNMKELFAHDFISDQHTERVPATDDQLRKWGLEDGDLLFGRRSLTLAGAGKISIVKRPPHRAVFESSVIRTRLDRSLASPEFYFYLFKSAPGRQIMETIVEQVAVAGIRSSDLAKLRVPVPPLHEQRRIASVLGALDDLIETERTITDAAIALMNAEFRRRFGNRPLALPVGNLGDVIDCLHSKKPEMVPGGRTLMQLNNIRDDGLIDRGPSYGISDGDYANWSRKLETRPGDLVITNVGRIGAVARVPDDYAVAIGRNMTAIRPGQPEVDGAFLIASLLSRAVRDEIEARTDSGTVMNALNVRSIPMLRLQESTPGERAAFHWVAVPFLQQADASLLSALELSRAHDELLPMLMSGKVHVADVGAA